MICYPCLAALLTTPALCIMTRLLRFSLLSGLVALCSPLTGYAQDHNVRGTVTDSETSEALPGVNILVKGTTTGTSTDVEGGFTLTAPSPNDTLILSYIGYQALEVPIAGRSTINVVLVPRAIQGDEVIVVGYGAQERQDITGSITSVEARAIQELPLTDAGEALQGRAAGVVALAEGNRPGQGVTIRVRGRRSLTAGNDPLFVVDGIPLEGALNTINPRDIESMQVLKDASATAIYGSRGANGVVLITTSRGSNRPTTVSYSGYYGLSQELGKPDMMNAQEFAEVKREAARRNGDDPQSVFTDEELAFLSQGVSTDYQDLLINNGYQQSHQLSVQGGDERTLFYLSGNYLGEEGIINIQGFTRYGVRLNLDHRVSDRFRVGTSSQISNAIQDWGSNPYGAALSTNPISLAYHPETGAIIPNPGNDPLIYNPLADLEENAIIDERKTLRVFGNLFGELDLADGLQYRVNFGPDLQDWQRGLFQGSMSTARQGDSPLGRKEHQRLFTYTFENILTYTKELNARNAIDLTGLVSYQKSRNERSFLQTRDLPYETQQFHNLGTGATIDEADSDLLEWDIMSYMGRANYQFADRYLLTLTGRFDGSSRLAEGNKWGFFPSVGLGWLITEEPFLANQGLFTELKLRASYGRTGNTAIDPYQTAGSLAREAYVFGDTPAFGYRPDVIASPDLQWEVSSQVNLGLDFGVLNDRVVGSVDVYQTMTTDLLLERQLPPTSGFSSILENIGETRNRGFELSLSTRNIARQNVSWTTDFSFFGNREKIISLYGVDSDGDGVEDDDRGNGWFIGQPLTVWYDYEKIGIWQLGEETEAARYGQQPGDIRVRDVNNDGAINQEDLVYLGTDIPKLTAGVTSRFRYKNVDFSVFVFGSFGHTIFNDFRVENSTLQTRYNNLNVDYWTPNNPTNSDPRPNNQVERPLYSNSRGYMSGSFLKVRNAQLGYTLPSALLNSYGIRYFRVYLSANTPLVFSKLDDSVDPEIYSGSLSSDGVPASRLWTIGVDVNF